MLPVLLRRRVALVALCGAAACSSNSASQAPYGALPASLARAHVSSSTTTLYVGDTASGSVPYYTGTTLAGRIVDGLNYGTAAPGLAVDGSSNLYVTGTLSVVVYRGRGGRVASYSGGIVLPSGAYALASFGIPFTGALLAAGSDLFVALNCGSGCSNSKILEFPLATQPGGGTPAPVRTISLPASYGTVSMTIDDKSNLYVSMSNGSQYQLRRYRPAENSGGRQLRVDVTSTSGIALDGNGNLLVCNHALNEVQIYPPGAATPARTIAQGLTGCDNLALSADRKTLFVVDQPIVEGEEGGTGVVAIFDYASGTREGSISQGITPGTSTLSQIAVDPPATPGTPY